MEVKRNDHVTVREFLKEIGPMAIVLGVLMVAGVIGWSIVFWGIMESDSPGVVAVATMVSTVIGGILFGQLLK